MDKYQVLTNILDKISSEAPSRLQVYYPPPANVEKVNQARSRAFIHLFLKVKLGLLEFSDREEVITDGPYDGGVDAYFIDQEKGRIYFIQSKFRSNAHNFEEKEISLNEIIKMEVDRILAGETEDEKGEKYNKKIQTLITQIQKVPDIGRYKHEIIILANLKTISNSQLKKILPGFPVDVFSFARSYDELVFPIVSGTYYSASDLFININLSSLEYSGARVSYPVVTKHGHARSLCSSYPRLNSKTFP
jgi:hypothetical protein